MHDLRDEATIREPVVLIVDDDPAVLEALAALLAPRLEPLFRVETAASGEEALRLVDSGLAATGRAAPIALVISDEKMPGMAGNDLLIALRQHESHRHGGRILITGYAGLESAKRAINESEVDKYYPKPWDAERDLVPAVGEILLRFVRRDGLANYLLSECLSGADELRPVLELRREWWLYLTHLGEEPENGLPEATTFLLDGDGDGRTRHVLLWRHGEIEVRPAAAVRLRVGADGDWALDQLAFWPEEANDATETLLLQAALLEARRVGAGVVCAATPRLRRDVYESVGFALDQAPRHEVRDLPAASVAMLCRLNPLPAAAAGAAGEPFTARFLRTGRLCRCAQTGCPRSDYAAERRTYFCPLDVAEGRVPARFPLRG